MIPKIHKAQAGGLPILRSLFGAESVTQWAGRYGSAEDDGEDIPVLDLQDVVEGIVMAPYTATLNDVIQDARSELAAKGIASVATPTGLNVVATRKEYEAACGIRSMDTIEEEGPAFLRVRITV